MIFPLATLGPTRVAFYTTAATVIPVILLALAVQLRAGRVFLKGIPIVDMFGRWSRIPALVAGFAWVCLTTVAEWLALDALWRDRDASPGFVKVMLLLGVIVVMLGTVDLVLSQIREEARDLHPAVADRAGTSQSGPPD